MVTLLAEVAVLISLFAVGLRLRLPLTWTAWRTPVKLASVTMLVTIAGIAVVAHFLLCAALAGRPAAGRVLAPTDPCSPPKCRSSIPMIATRCASR